MAQRARRTAASESALPELLTADQEREACILFTEFQRWHGYGWDQTRGDEPSRYTRPVFDLQVRFNETMRVVVLPEREDLRRILICQYEKAVRRLQSIQYDVWSRWAGCESANGPL